MEPLVSILIPAFNTEAFVADAIRSALAQTWQRTEIIVIDDGSTDRTADVCRGFASSEVAIITEPHQGAAAARNKALSLSQGDYIQWLDADDLLAPDKIARQLESVAGDRNGRTLLSCAWAYFHHSPSRASFVPTGLWADLSPMDWLLCKLQHNVYMQNATWLVSREVTDAAGPWDTRLTADDDGEYFCRVLLASEAVRFIPEAKTFYRFNFGGLSSIGGSLEKVESQFLSTQMHIHYLRSLEDSERVRAACLAYLQRFFAFVYPASPDIIDRSQRLASSLGGRLVTPRLSWKYAWIERLFGRPAAKRTSVFYNHYKGVLRGFWNRALERLEDSPVGAVSGNEPIVVPRRSTESLGWNEIGSIVILLVAAISLRDLAPAPSNAALLLRVVWVPLYAGALAALMLQFGAAWLTWTIRRQPALCIVLMIAAISCLWSLEPEGSFQKALSLAGTTVLGVFIGYSCSPQRIMRVLAWTLMLVIASSVLFALWFPLAPTDWPGWRGIVGHKNTLGAVATLAVVFSVVAILWRSAAPRWWAATLCFLSIVALIQSRSRTSIAASAFSLVALAYLSSASGGSRPTLARLRRLSLALVFCVSILPFFVGPLAAALGNDDPLNGRTQIWAGVATILTERPLTGYGYEVVWRRRKATLLPEIDITARRSSTSAHNSILDIAAELGIPAAIVACFFLFTALVEAARLFEREPSDFSVFALLFTLGIVVMGFTEAHLFRIHSMLWIMFVALIVAASRSLERLESASSGGISA